MNISNSSPYRQLAVVEKDPVVPIKQNGLIIIDKTPHHCYPPEKYTLNYKKKILFGLITRSFSEEKDVPYGSLYKCPKCSKIHSRKYLSSARVSLAWEDFNQEDLIKLWEKASKEERYINE